MQSQRTNEAMRVTALEYDELVGNMLAANVDIEELVNDKDERVVRLPHDVYLSQQHGIQARRAQRAKAKRKRRARAKA